MSYASRSTRRALLAYALLAVLILAGVTWGTITTLTLERERVARDALDTAKESIDRVLWPVIAIEDNREFSQYNACGIPTRVHSLEADSEPDALVEVSPLYDGPVTPWIKLHFQVSPDGRWQSPQVPDNCFWPPTLSAPDSPTVTQHKDVLQWLSATCLSYDTLASRTASANDLLFAYEDMPQRDSHGRIWTHSRHVRLKNERCEPGCCSPKNPDESAAGFAADEYKAPRPSALTPVWFNCTSEDSPQLAFVRSADIAGTTYYQGFLVDWERLKTELLDKIAEQLPSADLEPVVDVTLSARRRMIPLLNASIIADPAASVNLPWSSTHLAIVVAWAAALAVLGGVGAGIHSLLSLTERRTQFAYAVTHELRTPLTTLRLYTDMLASGLVKEADKQAYLQTLDSETERLSDIVDGVLEYARVENQAVKLDCHSLTIAELLRSIGDHCATRCNKAGKRLVVEVNGLAEARVSTDPQLVKQVLTNLVDNACKYARDADDPEITLRASEHHGDRIALEVEDHGPGIEVADRPSIFKPFRRGKSTRTNKAGGIGLGLALARSWSTMLNGNLELVTDRARPEGTCFRLTIPRNHT